VRELGNEAVIGGPRLIQCQCDDDTAQPGVNTTGRIFWHRFEYHGLAFVVFLCGTQSRSGVSLPFQCNLAV